VQGQLIDADNKTQIRDDVSMRLDGSRDCCIDVASNLNRLGFDSYQVTIDKLGL